LPPCTHQLWVLGVKWPRREGDM